MRPGTVEVAQQRDDASLSPGECIDGPVRRKGPSLEKLQADAALVARCRAGEVDAWDALYHRFHPPLLRAIEGLLGSPQRDPELVDELAARVWYALIDNDGALLGRFHVTKNARLGTFIRAVARDNVARYLREERRRIRREAEVCRSKMHPTVTAPDESRATLSEFRETLTDGEKVFLDDRLAEEPSGPVAPPDESTPRIWQLTSRLRRKLLAFFRDGQP